MRLKGVNSKGKGAFGFLPRKIGVIFASLFMVFVVDSLAELEPNNSCLTANTVIATGFQTGSAIGSSNSIDYDYYSFHVSANGELNVTITNTGNKELTYSALTIGSCPSSAAGTLAQGTSTVLSIPSTTAGTYYLYVKGNDPNAVTYSVNGLFTPNVLIHGTDLKITKVDSKDPVLTNSTFFYRIDVSNIGDQNASNVVVLDTLPLGMYVDTTATNDASPDWTCIGTLGTTTCTYSGKLLAGETSTIILYVQAPPTGGHDYVTITNFAAVSSLGIDVDPSNNTAREDTIVTALVDTAEGLCYADDTNQTNPTGVSQCDMKGNFYYGSNCDASVVVNDTNGSYDALSRVTVYKMYAPDLTGGTCNYSYTDSTASASGTCNNVLNTVDFGSYTEGYSVTVADNNVNSLTVHMYDHGTYTQPRLDGIALFGDYWTASGYHHKGRIYACTGAGEGGIEVNSKADVIDTPINNQTDADRYNNSTDTSDEGQNIKFIRTMIAGDPSREVTAVHLDMSGAATLYEYNGTARQHGQPLAYKVTPYIADEYCSDASWQEIIDPATNLPQVIEIPSGSYSATEPIVVPDTARRNARLVLVFVDPNTLSPEGQQCIANVNDTGNFAQMADCVNSEVQYKRAFGQDAWDRCGIANGSPCENNNHGWSCGEDSTSCPGYNPRYNNDLGCYLCTFNIQPSCSTDNFAIRPEEFDANISAGTIIKAGEATSLMFSADRYNTALTGTVDYNETEGSSFMVDVNISDDTKICPQPVIGKSPPVEYSNGLDTDDFTFNNIGDVNMTVSEINGSEYAVVDNDDTPDDDRLISPFTVPFRIIPHHFEVDAQLRDSGDGFTYLYDMNRWNSSSSDDYNLSTAILTIDINATGADGNITTNYIDTCYAKETNVTMKVHSTTIVPAGSLTQFLYYNPMEANATANSGEGSYALSSLPTPNVITELPIENVETTFNKDTRDGNGTAHIEYNLNFDRKVNKPVNPLRLALEDVEVVDTDSVYGDDNSNDTATFLYGRAHSPRYRVNCGTTATGACLSSPLQIFFEFYSSDSNLTLRRTYAQDINRSKDAIMWFHNTRHEANDGNITFLSHKYLEYVITTATSPLYLGGGIGDPAEGISEVRIGYRGTDGYPYKASVDLHTQKWLNYDRFNDNPDVNSSFLIEFNAVGAKVGEGDLSNTDEGPANSNRRIRW